MIQLKTRLTQQLQNWIKKRSPSGNPQCLSSRHLYILPSAFGWGYVIVLLTLGIGAINYQLNPAFLLIFLMMIIGILNLWQNHRNLQGLCIRCLAVDDAEQGQPANIKLLLSVEAEHRYALFLAFEESSIVHVEKISKEEQMIFLALKTPHRGHFKLPPLKIYSNYPLGLSRVWSYLYFDISYYVYPLAVSPGFWPAPADNSIKTSPLLYPTGDEELHELKSVINPWIQTSRIAWKISARGQGWYLKQMTSPGGEHWLFRLEELPSEDIEKRLQQLSYWIQTAEQLGHRYGLELNGTRIPLGAGKTHMQTCLRQLAMY
ncbi:DUF58 domain-containing protein [Legionella oakridgensis]|uniref:Transmembrane protein n=2 Tax=Legionella oakridgensis TaxID=29423 RepID=W0BHY8_9GAMM|nr:DUF58 domain-containing protein [Legionella oakridgensis]AHE68034.1 hypothetical protein Loa_02497 [Legionella oakridgensis ATCC 33761 = DSM 21215]ETO92462.1 hypothetical protein LOR_65c18200 [Legionella oakridgensis RV-2-2007]KTD44566.1 transmembrane protein [Legionella oakridgensis]STY21023.1 transmembrane protein [Legionella longbeachae]